MFTGPLPTSPENFMQIRKFLATIGLHGIPGPLYNLRALCCGLVSLMVSPPLSIPYSIEQTLTFTACRAEELVRSCTSQIPETPAGDYMERYRTRKEVIRNQTSLEVKKMLRGRRLRWFGIRHAVRTDDGKPRNRNHNKLDARKDDHATTDRT